MRYETLFRGLRMTPLMLLLWATAESATITVGDKPAQLNIRPVGAAALRVTLRPLDAAREFPDTPALARRRWPEPGIELREIDGILNRRIGSLYVTVSDNPLTVDVIARDGRSVQNIVFDEDGIVSFRLDDRPVLGLGAGGPETSREDWREEPLEYDRRGRLHAMAPRWQQKAYGSRNPVPMVIGTSGFAIYMNAPWVQVDLRDERRGRFIPWQAPDEATAQALQGRPARESVMDGMLDLFIFDAAEPATFMADVALIAGKAVMPPKWALGYMQSHRTLEDDQQMIRVVDTFRSKRIPIDAVIYQGTGFTPRGWNTDQPSFTFNPEVFAREPAQVIGDLHARNVKVIVHIVPPPEDVLPSLHGNVPPRESETVDASHIQTHWQDHVPLLEAGVDAFWVDEGDRFDLASRLNRHKMYYQGPLSAQPNRRPWSLHRNGYLGIARWGGWMWSGDTDSSWQTLEAQVMAGLNHSLSLSPYWGSDIGGFYPNEELTAELYIRWFQFAAFTPSFRGHGRTWWTRLPWGWGLDEMGPEEHRTNPLPSELNNSAIERIARKYSELRYRLLPYNYALAWQARDSGMPLMRPLWLHYPHDEVASGMGTQYLWGRDVLVAPVTTKGTMAREVYLPEGTWYDWWTGEQHSGGGTITRIVDLETMPLYVRAGGIIPLDPVRQYINQEVTEPTTLRVFRGADGEFTLYTDDGTTLNYLEGKAALTRVSWDDSQAALTIAPAPHENARERSDSRQFRIELEPGGEFRLVTYIGRRVTVDFSD